MRTNALFATAVVIAALGSMQFGQAHAQTAPGADPTGMTADGDRVGGPMVEVVHNTSQLSAEDRAAMAAYIKSLPPL